ncbi:MAG TPA: alpha/beta hydrolase, partial [Bacteroidota bacterium]|nr:alpha/beta hydrolase [Bacteroidota bacterium]
VAGMVRDIAFVTPAPDISARDYWVTIDAQQEQFKLSRVSLRFDPSVNRLRGTTTNVARMALDVRQMGATGPMSIDIDSVSIAGVTAQGGDSLVWLYRAGNAWQQGAAPPPDLKGRIRYGSFKNLFRNDVLFVYGTGGTAEEQAWAFNKARFDAERFWYQGNGSIEVVSDAEFSAARGQDRNIVLYGNSGTNSAWNPLLGSGPIDAHDGGMRLGERTFAGEDLGYVFIRPRQGSSVACVGAVGGTGIRGMRLTDRMPYLLPGVAFPDLIIARSSLLSQGESGIAATGFFGLDWSVSQGEFVFGEP